MKDGGLNVVLFAVGVVAIFLWYRMTAAQTTTAVAPVSAPGIKSTAAGNFGVGLASDICSLPGAKYIDFTGQCAKLGDPVYRQAVANSYGKVFSSKTPVGGVIKDNFLAVANPLTWGAGKQGKVDWRTGKPLNGQTATPVTPTGTPWKSIAVSSTNTTVDDQPPPPMTALG